MFSVARLHNTVLLAVPLPCRRLTKQKQVLESIYVLHLRGPFSHDNQIQNALQVFTPPPGAKGIFVMHCFVEGALQQRAPQIATAISTSLHSTNPVVHNGLIKTCWLMRNSCKMYDEAFFLGFIIFTVKLADAQNSFRLNSEPDSELEPLKIQ